MTLALKIFNMEALDGKELIVEIVDTELTKEQVSVHAVPPQETVIFGVHGTRHLRVKHPAAKEQPGEQNTAPQAKTTESHSAGSGAPAVAAPEAAAMVKRLEQFAFHLRTIENQYAETMREKIDRDAAELMDAAAAMIEKLGQQDTSELMDAVRRYGAVMTNDEIRAQLKPPPPERP